MNPHSFLDAMLEIALTSRQLLVMLRLLKETMGHVWDITHIDLI